MREGAHLTEVDVTNDDPLDALGLVVAGSGGNGSPSTSDLVLDEVGLAVLGVDSSNVHVVGDVLKVTAVLEPGTSHGDVVSGALALGLDEDGSLGNVLAIPGAEGGEELQTVRLGVDDNGGLGAISRGVDVGVLTGVKATGGKLVTEGGLELEGLAVLANEGVLGGVEVQLAGKGLRR